MNSSSWQNSSSNSTAEVIEHEGCPIEFPLYNKSQILGQGLAVPEWEAILTALALVAIILLTIIGNILVILSVFTYKPLRIVQNFFIVSLAVADLTVAILVLPLNVVYSLLGVWIFGKHACKMWLTCDVLCCTASILNLCAIALDRYWAITDPINYAQKRTLKRVLVMIGSVWLVSLIISSPPLIGWNDWPTEFKIDTPCKLTSQQGYVIYSSLGSFYIPLFIMTLVYIEIFIATKKRLRERAKASKLNTVKQNVVINVPVQDANTSHGDAESVSSEANHNDTRCSRKKKKKRRRKRGSVERKRLENLTPTVNIEDDANSATEMVQQSNHVKMCTSPALKSKVTVSVDEAGNCGIARKSTVYQFIEEKQRISLSKERRAARTLGIIMGVFVLCWLPFFLMYVILPFCPSCCPSEKLVNFVTWLGYLNSALNPIIYTIFNLDFRRAFKKLLTFKRVNMF